MTANRTTSSRKSSKESRITTREILEFSQCRTERSEAWVRTSKSLKCWGPHTPRSSRRTLYLLPICTRTAGRRCWRRWRRCKSRRKSTSGRRLVVISLHDLRADARGRSSRKRSRTRRRRWSSRGGSPRRGTRLIRFRL